MNRHLYLKSKSSALLGFLGATLLAIAADAGVVTNTNDSGVGSLRQVIIDAPAGDTITFAAGLAGQTIALSNAGDNTYGPSALLVNKTLTFVGPTGNSGITIARSGSTEMRLFRVTSGVSLTLRYLTLSNGIARGANGANGDGGGGGGGGGLGGAVLSEGTLRLENCTVTGNSAIGGDGGIGGLSTGSGAGGIGGGPSGGAGGIGFPGNAANGGFGSGGGGGGGSFESGYFGGNFAGAGGLGGGGGGGGAVGSNGEGGGGGFAPITGSRGGFNRGGGGGGLALGGAILNKSGSVILSNTTITGNSTVAGSGGTSVSGGTNGAGGAAAGGAILNYNGSVSIANSTLAGNADIYTVAENGGASAVTLTNTILDSIAYQIFAGNGSYNTSGNNNLIRVNNGFSGGVVSSADPLLGVLQNNGGSTATRALPINSVAVDAGDDSVLGSYTVDQRGSARKSRTHVDIGAYELQNTGPTATSQSLTVNQNTAWQISLSGTDPENDALSYAIATNPAHGSLGAVSGNMVTYTPTAGYLGSDSFTFKVTDAYGLTSSAATVSITVNGAPVANAQSVQTNQGTAKTITLAATDPESDAVTFSVVSNPAHGSLSAVSENQITYTPAAGYFGNDSFTFRATDAKGAVGSAATVSIAVNGAPIASAKSVTVNQGVVTTIILSATDPESDAITYSIVTGPTHGSLGAVSGNSVAYTPAAGYFGADSFTFRGTDAKGAIGNTATVSITVNASPTAANQTVATDQYTPITITLGGSDPEGGALTFSIVTAPAHGAVSAANNNQITYFPDGTYYGADSFTFKATDSNRASSNVATITVNVDGAPVAQAQSIALKQAASKTITLDAIDPEGDAVTYAIVTNPAHGALSPISGNQVIYTPEVTYFGPDSFTFRAVDSKGAVGNPATVSINVVGANGLNVTTVADVVADDGVISLREAVDTANLLADPTGSVVTFAPALNGQTISLSQIGDGTVGRSALLIKAKVIIVGSTGNSGITIQRASDAPAMRLFYVKAAGNLTLRNLSLGNGLARGGSGGSGQSAGGGGAGLGGMLFNDGTTQIVGCTLSGNVAQGGSSSGVINNFYKQGGGGGGLGNVASAGDGASGDNGTDFTQGGANGGGYGGVFLTAGGAGGFGGGGGGGGGTPFADGRGGVGGFGGGGGGGSGEHNGGGTAPFGGFGGGNGGTSDLGFDARGGGGGGGGLGGAMFNRGTLTLTNSTVAGNSAQGGTGGIGSDGRGPGAPGKGFGGALFNYNGTVTLVNSTLANNTAPQGGGGIYNLGDAATATLSAINTILAQTPGGATDFVGDTINGGTSSTSGNNNLIQSKVGFAGGSRNGDPRLGALSDNGGPTATMIPGPGNVAFDAGDDAVLSAPYSLTTDQRGSTFARKRGAHVDIGAYEIQADTVPTANPQSMTTAEDTPRTITMSGADGTNPLSYSIVTPPVHGSLGAITGNQVTYTPAADYNGADSFDFAATNAGGGSARATVSINITPVNDAPVALGPGVSDNYNDNVIDTSKWQTLLPLAESQVTEQNGQIKLQGRGYLYSTNEFKPTASSPVRVSGDVTPGADYVQILTRSDATPSGTFGETRNGIEGLINAASNYFSIIKRFNGGGVQFVYASLNLVPGNTYHFVMIDDGNAISMTVTEVGNPANTATINAADSTQFASNHVLFHNREGASLSTIDNVVVSGGLLITPHATPLASRVTATDAEGDALTFAKVSDAAHGSVAMNSDGTFTYTPQSNYSGPDSFTFKARDAALDSNVATVNIGVGETSSLVVTTTQDVTDPVDAQTSLREAIAYASTLAGLPEITFAPGVTGTITLGSQLTIDHDIIVTGPGANLLALSGNNATRVLSVATSRNVNLSGLTIASGRTSGQSGAGISNAGTLNITACAITSNIVTGIADAGGIHNNGGTLTVADSTFSGNSAGYGGGAIRNESGTTLATNCTFYGNVGGASGGAVQLINGSMALRFCTVNGNNAPTGGGLQNQNGNVLRASNTIIAGNTGGDVGGTLTNDGFNIVGANAGLDSGLNYNGGRTKTVALLAGSSAIDAGDPSYAAPPAYDQRGLGFARKVGPRVDIGAFETQPPNRAPVAVNQSVTAQQDTARSITLAASDADGHQLSYAIVSAPAHGSLGTLAGNQVTYTPATGYVGADSFTFKANDTLADSNLATVSITVGEASALVVTTLNDTQANDGLTSLREAIAFAATQSGSPTITFAVSGTIALASELPIAHNMTINGPGAGSVTLSGNNATRIFNVTAGTVGIANLKISNGKSNYGAGVKVAAGANVTVAGGLFEGNVASSTGAGIFSEGTLVVNDCTLSNNKAEPYGAYAGGVGVAAGTATINRSTLSGNTGTEAGAILNGAALTIINSTLSGNSSYGGAGAAIYNQPTGTLILNSSTIAHNQGYASGAGIFNYETGSTTIGNSIVAQNTIQVGGGPDIAGNITSADYNLFGSAPAGGVAGATSHNILSAAARLDVLKFNGGPTQTIALLAGSPAYEAGNNAIAGSLTTDQRGAGYVRKFGPHVDIGAFESQTQLDRLPVASVVLNTAIPKTNDILTATATKSDPDNDTVTLTFVWKKNGSAIKTTANSATLTDTLDLGVAGNGDKSEVITVTVTPNDGTLDGDLVTAQATVANTAPLAGRSGSAARFDGVDDYVKLPDNLFPYPTSGNGNAPMSFEAFFKTGAGGVILGQQTNDPLNDAQNGWVPAIYVGSNGKLHVVMFQHYADPATLQSLGSVTDNAWHQVAVSYDGTTERFYLDGALQASRAVVQVGYSPIYKYQFGTGRTTFWPADNGTWWSFNGMIDEVRVWNKARSAVEIASSWNKSLGAGEAGLLAYYRFDEPTGTSAFDYSGNGNAGTFMNGVARQSTAVLSGDFINDAATATLRDTALNGTMVASDLDNDALGFSKVADPSHGAVTVNANGTFTYTPASGYTGPDSFVFKASDGSVFSNNATVNITVVVPPNIAPTANSDTIERYANGSTSVTDTALLANDSDPDGNTPLTIVAVSAPASGQATVSRANGYVFYDPNPEFTGADTFTYTVSDSLGATSIATVTVNIKGGMQTNTGSVKLEPASGGGMQSRVKFTGVPGRTYRVQFTDSLDPPQVNWQTIATMAADAQGNLEIVDPPPLPSKRYYRTLYP